MTPRCKYFNYELQEGDDDGGEVVVPDQDMSAVTGHYRDNTGPIRGYPGAGARSDAFVWRPY